MALIHASHASIRGRGYYRASFSEHVYPCMYQEGFSGGVGGVLGDGWDRVQGRRGKG